jgi:polysaccharide pyruvyl transferase WcaK-like protein
VRLIIGNRDKDTHASRQLVAAVPGVICSSINSYSDVLAEIAASDLVIATRFHNILKGFVLGRPAISIGYAAKNDDLMHDMGLGDYCHAADSVDADLVLAQFGQMCGMAAPPTASILEKRTAYRQLLEQQYDRLVAGLAGSSVATA